MTGKSLAHFFPNFFVAPWEKGANFETGRLCKIRHLENSILHNWPVPKLAPFPQGGHKKNREKMCKTYARHCKTMAFLITESLVMHWANCKSISYSETARYAMYALSSVPVEGMNVSSLHLVCCEWCATRLTCHWEHSLFQCCSWKLLWKLQQIPKSQKTPLVCMQLGISHPYPDWLETFSQWNADPEGNRRWNNLTSLCICSHWEKHAPCN